MNRKAVSTPETQSVGTSRVGPPGEQSAPTRQDSLEVQTQDRIARRAYELYEQRGRQEGRALEDWLDAERHLVDASEKS